MFVYNPSTTDCYCFADHDVTLGDCEWSYAISADGLEGYTYGITFQAIPAA
jgi:hypothetical protein